jgi:hypothetical protein
MATVWTFGDSFTDGFRSIDSWAKKYVKWKGYQPKTYGEIIAENLGFELVNLGKGGSDNYSIFETFCESIGRIKQDDIIIFGWSSPLRYRLISDWGFWRPILPATDSIEEPLKNISMNTINEILVNRNHILCSMEVNNWIRLINLAFKDNKIVHWTAFKCEIDAIYVGASRITLETNGEIDDGHFSEKGHLELSEILMTPYIKNKKLL